MPPLYNPSPYRYDLGAAVALWRPALRPAAMALGVCFHGGNSLIFRTIHSFPFVCRLEHGGWRKG